MSMNSKSKLADFRASVTISAPIGEVWKKLVDWKSQGQWMALTKVNSSADRDGSSGIGTTISAFTGIGKIGIWDEMKITVWSPETFCAVDHYGRWIKGIGEFRLIEIAPGETRFDWYERIDAPAAILALIKPGILLAVNYSLAKFARGFNN